MRKIMQLVLLLLFVCSQIYLAQDVDAKLGTYVVRYEGGSTSIKDELTVKMDSYITVEIHGRNLGPSTATYGGIALQIREAYAKDSELYSLTITGAGSTSDNKIWWKGDRLGSGHYAKYLHTEPTWTDWVKDKWNTNVTKFKISKAGTYHLFRKMYLSDNSGGVSHAPSYSSDGTDHQGEYVDLFMTLTVLEAPVINNFYINNEDSYTESQTVKLNNTCTNSPTHYKASENNDFSSASWKTYDNNPSFKLSDGAGWKTVYFKVKSDAGESLLGRSDDIEYKPIEKENLEIIVKNVDGNSSPLPGANGKIKLYNSSNDLIDTKATNSGGIALFENLAIGSYWYEVFHNGGTIFGEEFWGTKEGVEVIAGQTNYSTFTRDMPYTNEAIKVFDGKTDVTEQTVKNNTQLTFRVEVKNNGESISTASRVVLDRDKTASYDFDDRSQPRIISQGGTEYFEFLYTPTIGGDYFGIPGVYSDNSVTDGWDWGNTPLFKVTKLDSHLPTVKVMKVYQTGDQQFSVIAQIDDKDFDLNNDKLYLHFMKIPLKAFVNDRDKIKFERISGNYYIATAFNPSISTNKFDVGQDVVWKITTEDNEGNTFNYPDDLETSDRVQIIDIWAQQNFTKWDSEWWVQRIKVFDYQGLSKNYVFDYKSIPSGAITFEQVDGEIFLTNNTAIWYEVNNFTPNSLSLDGRSILKNNMLPPREGVIPTSFEGIFGDRGVKINGINENDSKISFTADRKSTQAIFWNSFDMFMITVKPKIPLLPEESWLKVGIDLFETLITVKDLVEIEVLVENSEYKEATIKMLDLLFEDSVKEIFLSKVSEEMVRLGFSDSIIKKTAQKLGGLLNGVIDILKGINNRIAFIYDLFKYPWDQESIILIKNSPLYLDYQVIPGYRDRNSENKMFVSEDSKFMLKINVPEGNRTAYFNVFAVCNIYDANMKLLETTNIENDDLYNGKIIVNYAEDELMQGVDINTAHYNKATGFEVSYDFNISNSSHKFRSCVEPYYMEVILTQGGSAGSTTSVVKPDTLINSGKFPFYLFDKVKPDNPTLSPLYNDGRDIALSIDKNSDIDIDYYKIYRKLSNESSYKELLDERIYNLGYQKYLYYDKLDPNIGSVDYKISAVDISGNEGEQSKITIVGVEVKNEFIIPTEYSLSQNYPNPFNPSTIISYSLPKQSHVLVKVFDVLGSEVATLVNETKSAGYYDVSFDASQLSNGVYVYKIQAGNFIDVKKMILLK